MKFKSRSPLAATGSSSAGLSAAALIASLALLGVAPPFALSSSAFVSSHPNPGRLERIPLLREREFKPCEIEASDGRDLFGSRIFAFGRRRRRRYLEQPISHTSLPPSGRYSPHGSEECLVQVTASLSEGQRDEEIADAGSQNSVGSAELTETTGALEDGENKANLGMNDVPSMPEYALPIEEDEVDAIMMADAMDRDTREDQLESNGLEDQESEQGGGSPLNGRGIIIIDNFSPYHGKHLSRMAREAYGAGVVSALSNYITGYLYQEKGMTDHLSARLPDLSSVEDVDRWVSEIPFEIVGIICESDSGLEDAERLGEALGLYPDRHDGFNAARRDKFLMNKACERVGLRVVRQKMCENLEEALDFAKELGVCEKDDSAVLEMDERDPGQKKEKYGDPRDARLPNAGFDPTGDDCQPMPENTGVLGLLSNHLREDSVSLDRRYCVVKPARGVASDDVHLCQDLRSTAEAFCKIQGSTVFGTMDGEKHDSVLVQEFATGTEYAVDIVSKAGQNKVAALWRYDKRPVNGAPFVYHATELVDADTHVGRAVCEYAIASLDALNVNWGLSHIEVIVDGDGPRLVEVNCRQHNTDFAPLTSGCIGYNALDMLLSAYLGDAEIFPPNSEHKRLVWDEIPDLPVTRSYGAVVHLVSHSEGVLRDLNVPALEEIEGMNSVLAIELYPHFSTIGEPIEKTVDIRSDCGWVHLMNEDAEQFKANYNKIVEIMPRMFVVDGADEHENGEKDEGCDNI